MDALIVVSILVLCYGCLSMQFPQHDFEALNVTTASTNHNKSTITNANSTVVRCATARGIPGRCVERRSCDYSTYAIDLTLYATKTYKKTCSDSETCCPFSSLIMLVESTETLEDKELTFDDSDE